MSRSFVPSVLMVALACGGLAWGEGATSAPATSPAYPSLENRVGKTITIAMPQRQPEKAVILQVWRMANGQAAMQAHSLVTGEPLTIVEDEKAKTLAERFVVYRWKPDGTPPPGCPLPPANAKVAGTAPIMQTETKVASSAPAQGSAPASGPITQVSAKGAPQDKGKTATTEVVKTQPRYSAGLMPPKEETKVTTTPTETPTTTVKVTQPTQPIVATTTTAPIMQVQTNQVVTVPAPSAPVVVTTMPSSPYAQTHETKTQPNVIAPMSSSPYAASSSTVVTTSAASTKQEPVATTTQPTAAKTETTVTTTPSVKAAPAKIQTVGTVTAAPGVPHAPVSTMGKKTIIVTEDGKDRTCVVLSESKVKGGGSMMKVQACDNGECFTVSCCGSTCNACDTAKPCPAPCPVVKRCDPVVVESKPCPAPCPQPCPPCPKVECKVECKPEKKVVKCDPCDRPLACKPYKVKCTPINTSKMLSVPVPGVPLWTPGCTPNVPPPCAHIGPYNTMESPAMRDYMAKWDAYEARQAMKKACGPVVHASAMGQMGVLTDAYDAQVAKNTLYLMTVLQTSPYPQNRAWAADRLKVVNDPKYQAYVADALIISAQSDPMPEVRMTAMASLGVMRVNHLKMQEMLAKTSQDQNDGVRQQAAQMQAKMVIDGMLQQTGFAAPKNPYMDR